MNTTVTPIINLDDYRSTRGVDGGTEETQATVQEIVSSPHRESGDVSFGKFYPLGESEGSDIAEAITLLREGVEKLEEAIALCQGHDAIGCDDCLQQVVALLPETFVWGRSAGDGFSAVILATFHCVKNAAGPLSEHQLLALRSGLKNLLHAPYIDFAAALDIQEAYESAGLDPDSKEVNNFSEFIPKQGEGVC